MSVVIAVIGAAALAMLGYLIYVLFRGDNT